MVPAFSFASTTTPVTVTSEQTQVDQRQELMLQLISLLRTYIAQLQQQLALKGVTGAPIVLGVAISTATSTEQAETPKKRRGGGGGGGGGSRNNPVVIPPVATTTDPGTGTTTDDGTDSATSTLGYATVIKLTDSKGNTYEQSEYNDKDSDWPSPRPTLTVGETVTITVDVENQIAEPVQYQFIGTGFPNEWQENNFVTVTIDEDVFNTETIHLRVFVKNSDNLYRAPDYDDLIQVFYTKGQSTSTIDETEPLLSVELLSSDTYTQGGGRPDWYL